MYNFKDKIEDYTEREFIELSCLASLQIQPGITLN